MLIFWGVVCFETSLKVERKEIQVNTCDMTGWTALLFASYYGRTLIVQELLKHPDTDVSHRSEKGKLALDLAAEKGHDDIVQILSAHPSMQQFVDQEVLKYSRILTLTPIK